MKKSIVISVIILCIQQQVFAQSIKVVQEPTKISKSDQLYSFASIAPDGSAIAASKSDLKGIIMLDLKGEIKKEITDAAGAGWKFSWSPDAGKIAYRENKYNGNIRSSIIVVSDINGKILEKSQEMVNSTLPYWNSDGSMVMYHEDNKDWQSLGSQKNNLPVITSEGNKVLVFNAINTNRGLQNLTFPAEILNMSTSPSGNRHCFEVAGYGIYVYEESNNSLIDLGPGEFPCWVNEDYFAFMLPKDDGYKMLTSDILIKKYNANDETNITAKFPGIALYPSCDNKGHIVFTTDHEELYIMQIAVQ
ncbi:MAG: hypothetical protein HYV28_04225 [Ignavibacteriales bacterium]|nr:hypothetical protein [Ignavibacteriales bacterium]